MNTVSSDVLLSQLNWRYATKKFDPAKKIPAALWNTLEQTLVLSPSAYGMQPYRFIVVEDPAVREALKAVSWGQTQVTDASHFVVFAGKKDISAADVDEFLDLTARVRGAPRDLLQKYRDLIVGDLVHGPRHSWIGQWTARQAYIAFGNLMTAAALVGVDTCPLEGLDPAKYDEILGLPQKGLSALCACALGYRAADDKYAILPKVRFPASTLIEHR